MFKVFYLYGTKYLPDQYNEIMNLLYSREMRTYLPIQELNILLEPVQDPSQIVIDQENKSSDGEEEEEESNDESTRNNDEPNKEEDEIDSDDSLVRDMSISDQDDDNLSSSADEEVGLNDV